MKKSILLSCVFALVVLGSQQAFAGSAPDDGKNQEKQPVTDKIDGIDIDTTSTYSPVIIDSESPENERRIAPALVQPKQAKEQKPEQPAEDQSNTAVSSFNFLYYLIEKVKFPDLLDESF